MTPVGIDLVQYRTQAKDLLKQARTGDPGALQQLREHHPESESLLREPRLQLADAQLVIARKNGYASWAKLKAHLLFLQAVAALDSGNIGKLEAILDECPPVVHYHCHLGEYESGYFSGATLLHHVAGNPIRCPIPSNVIEIARLLLERGADPNAIADTSTTIRLLLTSRQASEAGVAVPLIELLIASGATDKDLEDPDLLSTPLWNGGRATAKALVRRGAVMNANHAVGLGRLDILPALLGEQPASRTLEEALVYACVQNEEETVRYLVGRGAKGDTNVSPRGQSSALHNAAWRGWDAVVDLLVSNGARVTMRDNQWNGTPGDWAEHGGHVELAARLHQLESVMG